MQNRLCRYIKLYLTVLAVIIIIGKGYGQQEPLENIKIVLDFANDPGTSLKVTKSTLRYNKDFAVILQMDNSDKDLFAKVYDYFRGFNGNPGLYFTSGVVSNAIYFKMGANIYSLDSQGKDIHDTDPEKLTWSDLQTLWAAGFDIANQGVTYPPSEDDYYEVNRGISYSKKRFNQYFNQPTFNPHIYVVPYNKTSQIPFAKDAGALAIYSDKPTTVTNPFNASNYNNFYNFELKRGRITNNLFDDISLLATLSQNGTHMIGTYYCSGFDKAGEISFDEFKNQMNQVAAAFGKDGSDNIWVATANEVFEYLNLYSVIELHEDLQGNHLEITLSADNLPKDYRYYALTIVVSSDENITGLQVAGAQQSNYKFSNKTALINLLWEGSNPPTIYETVRNAINLAQANPDSAHCLIANDFLGLVSNQDSLTKYQQELCGICPDINFDFCSYSFNIPDDTICTGDTTVLHAPEGMQSYLWSNDSTTQSIAVSPQSTTEYWVEVVTPEGETARDTVTVYVYNSPVIAASQNDTVLIPPGSTDTLWVSVDDEVSFLWNTGDTDTAITVPAPEAGEASYYVDITKPYDDYQCVKRKEFTVQKYFLSNIDFVWDTVCFGDTTTMIANINTNDSVVAVKWDLQESGNFEDAEGDTVKTVLYREGNVLVGMRVVYYSGNMDVAYNVVPVADKPLVAFSYENACFNNTTQFHDSSKVTVGYLTQWFWDYGDGYTGEYQNSTHYYQEAGSYDVTLKVISSLGCADSLTKSIDIVDLVSPVLITSTGNTIGYNDTVVFSESNPVSVTVQNATSYDSAVWNGTVKGFTVAVQHEGNYSVVVYQNGCSKTMTFTTVNSATPGPGPGTGDKIMNLFTPNGDGYNDTWVINAKEVKFPVKVSVYTRYGNKVYSSDNYQNDWNGYFNGNPLPQATYYYIIEDAAGKTFQGPVTIIR